MVPNLSFSTKFYPKHFICATHDIKPFKNLHMELKCMETISLVASKKFDQINKGKNVIFRILI